jgi:hypothetical protein
MQQAILFPCNSTRAGCHAGAVPGSCMSFEDWTKSRLIIESKHDQQEHAGDFVTCMPPGSKVVTLDLPIPLT